MVHDSVAGFVDGCKIFSNLYEQCNSVSYFTDQPVKVDPFVTH